MEGSKAPIFRFSPRPNRASEIHWRPWGPQAFEEATQEDKPILLSISAVWCHWCHVMDETTYSDPQIIEAANRDFIPVRVDTDRQPEVNRRYNQGGWPTTAFLLPTGEILTGATYVPPQQMAALMDRVLQYYRHRRSEIEAKLAEMKAQREASRRSRPSRSRLSWQIIEELDNAVLNSYDWVYGGFGHEPKFPHTDALQYALARLHQSGDESWRKLLKTTLQAMAEGGMFDHVEGGFFRYSTTRDWSVPHFEKMLEDNSLLLGIYAAASDILKDAALLEVTRSVANYLRSTLFQEDLGIFGGSQDADEDYYALKSLKARRNAHAPYVDPTVYADWNAIAARNAISYCKVSGDTEWWDVAQRTLHFLASKMYSPQAGMCHFWDGEARGFGNLSDQVHAAHAFLDSYEAGGPEDHFAVALALMSIIRERFGAPEGGFYDAVPDERAPGYLAIPDRPLPENALAAELAFRLSQLTDDATLRSLANDTLAALAGQVPQYGLLAAQFGRVVHRMLTEMTHVVVVGDSSSRGPLLNAALRPYHSNREVEPLGPDLRPQRLAERGYPPITAAHVCMGTLCLEPTADPAAVEQRLREAVPRPVAPEPHPDQEL